MRGTTVGEIAEKDAKQDRSTSLNPGESDFLIICKGKEHKVAKETLSTKSNVLAAICKTHSSVRYPLNQTIHS